MKSASIRAALLGAVLLQPALAAVAHALEVGEAVPPVELRDGTQAFTLAAEDGKVTYIDFWASWCGPCRQSFPWMNEMQQKYGAQGLRIVGVNLDAEAADAQKFLASLPAGFTIAYDPEGESAQRFGVQGMPTSVLAGRDGKVIFQHAGFNRADADELEKAIRAALGAQP